MRCAGREQLLAADRVQHSSDPLYARTMMFSELARDCAALRVSALILSLQLRQAEIPDGWSGRADMRTRTLIKRHIIASVRGLCSSHN